MVESARNARSRVDIRIRNGEGLGMREVFEVVDMEMAIPVVALLAMGGGMIVNRVRNHFR